MTSLGCPGGGNADYCLACFYATLFQKKNAWPPLASGSSQGDAILVPVFLRGQLDAIGQTKIFFGVLCAESRVTLELDWSLSRVTVTVLQHGKNKTKNTVIEV